MATERQIDPVIMAALGYGMDSTRNTWAQFGYPTDITFDMYMGAYLRQPAAHALIERMLGKCWSKTPEICELRDGDESASDRQATPWEKEVAKLFRDKKIRLWDCIKDTDRMNMIGRYAGLIMRIADGATLDMPAGSGKLVEAVPCYESQIKVTAWGTDPNSADFGKPTMCQFRSSEQRLKNPEMAAPEEWANIHPSRIIFLAEGAPVGKWWEGVPFLQACYNKLIDLEKISGGSADAYKKNSAMKVALEYGEATSPYDAIRAAYPDAKPAEVREKLDESVSKVTSGQDSVIVMQNGKANQLQAQMIDPTGSWTIAANEAAASQQIPFTILFGQQTGRLASDQDQSDFAKVASSRRADVLTPFIENIVQWLADHGCISAAPQDFVIEWDDLLAPGQKDKLANAKTMIETNKAAIDAGQAPVYDTNEARVAGGYDPREEGEEEALLAELRQAAPDNTDTTQSQDSVAGDNPQDTQEDEDKTQQAASNASLIEKIKALFGK